MKLLFDLFPVILFFAAYKFAGIYVATAVAIAATVAQIGWVYFRHRKIDAMLWVSLAIISVFGGATLFLHDEAFIKWKPTVLYWLFAAVLLGSRALLGKNLIRSLMEKQISLPDRIWQQLNLSWAGFFVVIGFVNLYVAYTFSTDAWVNFKLFGITGLLIVFIILQSLLLSKHVNDEEKS